MILLHSHGRIHVANLYAFHTSPESLYGYGKIARGVVFDHWCSGDELSCWMRNGIPTNAPDGGPGTSESDIEMWFHAGTPHRDDGPACVMGSLGQDEYWYLMGDLMAHADLASDAGAVLHIYTNYICDSGDSRLVSLALSKRNYAVITIDGENLSVTATARKLRDFGIKRL